MPPSPSSFSDDPAGVVEAERATGIARATLRIWERRYGFPNPRRDRRGERFYDEEQIAKLRLMARLVARGKRPGALVKLPLATLEALATQGSTPADVPQPLLALLRTQELPALTAWLQQQLAATGLERFTCETLPWHLQQVGDAWARGDLQIHEEHLFTECVQQVLRSAIAALPPPVPEARPRVLTAGLPREQHGLGLLMVQALVALARCPALPLGLNTPPAQLAAAAQAWKADVVALSFSQAMGSREALAGLADVRAALEPATQLWVGGQCAALERRTLTTMAGVRRMAALSDVPPALARWQAAAA